ncbi:MAG TPA: hypothetical protein VGM91_18700 [Conexibacter sp.]
MLAVVLVVLVKGCVSSGHDQSLKDYNTSVRDLVQASRSDVARPLFSDLRGASNKRGEDLTTQLNQLRVVAERQLEQAEALKVPSEASEAQQDLELVLSLRHDGVQQIADNIQAAISSSPSSNDAITAIAAQMQAFNASDVVYSQRVAPLILSALRDNGIAASFNGGGEQVLPYAPFLSGANFALMSPQNVATLLGASTSSTNDSSDAPTPGLHGHQLDSVSVSGTTLDPSTPSTLPASPAPTFDIGFTNGGDSDEQNVRVDVEITPATGGTPITASTIVPTTTAGAAATAQVQLRSSPPAGEATVRVTIAEVSGERSLDNNTATYDVQFE